MGTKKPATAETRATKDVTTAKPRKKQATLTIQYYRSAIGFSKEQKRVVRGLGFGRLNATREFQDTPAVRGMVRKVPHLVRIVGGQS